jgi:hypothetical protein
MNSISFAKLLTLGCFALMLPVACGDDDGDDPGPGAAGQASVGGEGGASAEIPGTGDSSESIECGGDACVSTPTLLPSLFIDPCCTAGTNSCGVSSGFLTLLGTDLGGACLPKDQPGELDSACPDSPANSVPFGGQPIGVEAFKGCCRAATNTCGFLVDDIITDLGKFTSPKLGCVDSAAFTREPGVACGQGGGGGGGAGGGAGEGAGGGAGGESLGGGAGEGGAPVVGGAGGAGGAL